MNQIIRKIAAYKEKYEKAPQNKNAKAVSREEFTLLLSGIATCRKMPGIPVYMGYETLYHCSGKEDIKQGLEHMERLFGIKDKESLIETCVQTFSGSSEYKQFMTFWNAAPLFDLNELTAKGQEEFQRCKQLAENFYPLVEEKGFYAWDINERIGLCRKAVACGIISEKEFWQMTDPWVRQAQVFYHSYGEYAVSCLCGALYDMGRYDSDISGFFEINRNIIDSLLGEGGAWQRNQWYVPKKREWADLLGSNPGCFVTKKALEQHQIGYMYHEEPCPGYPDSGWRFFVGDETQEYLENPEHTSVCGLNEICNLYPDILAFVHAGVGRRFGRQENGWEEE